MYYDMMYAGQTKVSTSKSVESLGANVDVDVLAGRHYLISDDFRRIKQSSTREFADMTGYM